ncbi:MAG TPA: clostripain-related cysteine peptidase, partial [Caldilineaceae bacterium]|nr:clostripain-related cysteine peptidase [Caldilineaceae bacterium]
MAHRFGQPPRGLSITLLVLMLVSVLFATARAAPPSQADEAEWLLMFYVDADDDTLELDMLIDLQEAELIGSTDQVHIVAQVDRFKGSFDGMGDFTGAKRFYITQDADVNVIGSEVVQELGEVNMADSKTLLDFITWAVANYPARKTMLVLSDHGIGWPGGFGDPDPDVQGAHNIFLREAFGHDNLWLMEIDDTLAKARKATGIEQFDIVGFDACLMAQLEIFTALAPHARYSVASEETEPGVGWAYTAFLAELVQNPEMEGADLSQAIVANYIDQDMRLRIDPNFTGGLEPEVVAQQLFHDATLTAVDLSQIGALNRALDELTVALSAIDQKAVAQARSYAQAYESVFGEEWPSPYIDLGSFLGNVTTQNKDAGLKKAADGVKAALGKAVIAERHGAGRPGSSGIAIYFPVPSMHAFQDNWGYTQVAARFAAESQWDEFLAFHSNGGIPPSFSRPKPGLPEQVIQQFGELIAPEDVELLFQAIEELRAEELDAETIAAILTDDLGIPQEVVDFLTAAGALGEQPPGAPASSQAKPIRVSPIALSAEVAEPGAPVNIQSEISGDQVGFVYSFIGRFLPNENVLIIEDRDYIFADENETVGGVTYPVWPEGGFVVDFDWEPTVYAISDGETSLRVLFQPESYGETPTYSVEAIYHFANGGPDRYARLFFREGELLQILGFTGAATNGVGAPWEIRPTPGDSVTILEQSINLDPEATDDSYTREIGDLTFGESRFFIEETPAPSGNYVVGIIAEDLAGNTYEQYEGLFVVNEEAAVEDGVLPYVNDELAFALLYP